MADAVPPKSTQLPTTSDTHPEANRGIGADDPMPSDDPRYQSWLMIKAFVRSEESSAQAELLKTLQKDGTLGLDDILKSVERVFSSVARSLVMTVKGTDSAQQRDADLDELLKRVLQQFEGWFEKVARAIGVDAPTVKREAEIRLTTPPSGSEWKAELFRLALQGELAKHGAHLADAEKRSDGEPATLTKAKSGGPPLRCYKSPVKRAIANALVKSPNASDLGAICRSIDEDGTAELEGKGAERSKRPTGTQSADQTLRQPSAKCVGTCAKKGCSNTYLPLTTHLPLRKCRPSESRVAHSDPALPPRNAHH